jgi:hypothetical protein
VSRSRWPKCSGGRGCWVCGDAGEVRRKREAESAHVEAVELAAHLEDAGLRDYCDGCTWCDSSRLDWIEWERSHGRLLDVQIEELLA